MGRWGWRDGGEVGIAHREVGKQLELSQEDDFFMGAFLDWL